MQRRKAAGEQDKDSAGADGAAPSTSGDAGGAGTAVARKPDSGPTHRNIIPVISGLLLHSSAMILVPFGAFGAIVYDWADPLFAMTTGIPERQTKNSIAAILAVLLVNVVVASFVFRAFREEDPEQTKKKQ